MKVIEPQVFHKIYEDVIQGEHVKVYQKYLREATGIYSDTTGVDLDTLLYTVYSYEAGSPEKTGDLYWGLTILEPVTVNEECNMTRGHFHLDQNCAEFYFGVSGTGLLLLMDKNGETWAEKITKGSLHHIDGQLAHRLINIGEEPLGVGACWPTTAGHDYGAIEEKPFRYRVFKRNKKIVFEESE